MKFFDKDGIEIDINTLTEGSLVVARVTKPMSNEEFLTFCKGNSVLDKSFRKRGIDLVYCPDWVEFKEWKSQENK